jgi:A/G-specific adenine glycosylase
MRALPTGPWVDEDPGTAGAPADLPWRDVGTGRHVFTHFALEYRVLAAQAPSRLNGGEWWPLATIETAGLPTLFARAAQIAMLEQV